MTSLVDYWSCKYFDNSVHDYPCNKCSIMDNTEKISYYEFKEEVEVEDG